MLVYKMLRRFETHRQKKVGEMIEGKNRDVLEIGCADGTFLFDNRKKWRSAIGVDVRHEAIRKAKKRDYGVSMAFYISDFGQDRMHFASNQFDIVVSIATMQYIADLQLFFTEVRRVLRKEGLFIFEVPNFVVFWRRFQLFFGKLPSTSCIKKGWDSENLHYFTEEHTRTFVMKYGFNIEKVTTAGIFSQIRSIYPSFLGADLIFVCRNTKL